ncbi:MAG: hypothetical protein H0V07_01515 [Propionibacteriales bacterium]|nr:hypothetical protein [Propionibacteriales bacterium]
MVLLALVLACLVAAAVVSTVYPSLLRLALVGALGVAWLLTNGPIEGDVLLSLSRDHGLTVADLALVVVLPAGWSYLTSSVQSRRRQPVAPADKP